jgi:hypothetical protein
MPSSGEVGRGVTTSVGNDGCAATGFATAGLTEAALGAAGVSGAGFSGLAVLRAGVTIGFSAFVSCEVMGWEKEVRHKQHTPLGRRCSTAR